MYYTTYVAVSVALSSCMVVITQHGTLKLPCTGIQKCYITELRAIYKCILET